MNFWDIKVGDTVREIKSRKEFQVCGLDNSTGEEIVFLYPPAGGDGLGSVEYRSPRELEEK